MRTVVVPIVRELLDHDHGHWCRRCARSSGVRAWVAVRFPTGAMSLQIPVWCEDCGSRDVVVDLDARGCSG